MKRCIICGNIGDENSTVCNVCGGSFEETAADRFEDKIEDRDDMLKTQDMERISKELEAMLQRPEADEKEDTVEQKLADIFGTSAEAIGEDSSESDVTETSLEQSVSKEVLGEDALKEDALKEEVLKKEAVKKEAVKKSPEKKTEKRQPRRMKSEPQIYGQSQMGDASAAYNGQQGMMRKNLQGRPANGPQGQPVNGPQGRPMAPQGQPVNGPQGRPMAPQGQPMNGPQGRPMAPQGQPMNGPQGQPAAPQARFAKAVKETARKCMKSPLFFLIALLNTVGLAGSVAAIFMKELNYSQMVRLITEIGLPAQAAGYLDEIKALMVTLDTSAVGVNLVLLIPELLFCLGLWMVYFCALGAKEKMSTVGFSFMKINVVLGMIVSCAAVLVGLIISVTLVVAAWASGTQNMIIGAIVTMVVMIVIAMLVIMYYFCYFATLKTCRVSAKSGETYGNASAYVALVHILAAFICVIGLLSGIVNMEISNIAGFAGKMGWMLLFGFWIFGYKKKMKEFVEE